MTMKKVQSTYLWILNLKNKCPYLIVFQTKLKITIFHSKSIATSRTFPAGSVKPPGCCDWFELWHLHSRLPLSLSFSSLLYCEMAPQMAALPHLFMCFRTVVVSFPPTCIKHRGITNSHWQSQHLGTYRHVVKQVLSERSLEECEVWPLHFYTTDKILHYQRSSQFLSERVPSARPLAVSSCNWTLRQIQALLSTTYTFPHFRHCRWPYNPKDEVRRLS